MLFTKFFQYFRSSRDSYLDSAVGYVQVCREGTECKVKARVVPEHRVNNKPYTVVCKINEVDDVIIDSICEDCAAAAGNNTLKLV